MAAKPTSYSELFKKWRHEAAKKHEADWNVLILKAERLKNAAEKQGNSRQIEFFEVLTRIFRQDRDAGVISPMAVLTCLNKRHRKSPLPRLPIGVVASGDPNMTEIPCNTCIKMVAETCRTSGKCLHEQFQSGSMSDYSGLMGLSLGDCDQCDGYVLSASEAPLCPTCARLKRKADRSS